MPNNHLIKFRVNGDQYHRILADAYSQGFDSLASYMRFLALNKNRIVEEKIVEVHKAVVKNEARKN